MNIEKTRQYYAGLTDENICDCAYCQNYVHEIKAAYPDLSEYLASLGVDIEKPFETMPVEPENGKMFYCGVQYIVLGTAEHFKDTLIDGVRVFVTDSHPMTNIKDDHFVIEVAPIYLKWDEEGIRDV